MKEKTCCFTGHRDIRNENKKELCARIGEAVFYMLQKGITDFWCGGALGFDTLAAAELLKIKKERSEIKLFLAVPCPSQTSGWSRQSQIIYDEISKKADKAVLVSDSYYPGCMQKRNRFMIDESTACIAYYRKNKGGTYSTVKYARERGLEIYFV